MSTPSITDVKQGQDGVMQVLLERERISLEGIFADSRRVFRYGCGDAHGYAGLDLGLEGVTIHFLVVAPSHRGKGHGTKFLTMIEEFADRSSLDGVYVPLDRNRRFFQNRGYQEQSDRLAKRIAQD